MWDLMTKQNSHQRSEAYSHALATIPKLRLPATLQDQAQATEAFIFLGGNAGKAARGLNWAALIGPQMKGVDDGVIR